MVQGERRGGHGTPRGRAEQADRPGQARRGRPADADHYRHDAQGVGGAGCDRRSVCRDKRTAARLLSRRLRKPRRSDRDRAPAVRRRRRLGNPPGAVLQSGERREVTDMAWIEAAIASARPQAMAALLRYFRNLDTAEEAFQEACLRALQRWTQNGPPRDPAAWLILVGRNFALDEVRQRNKEVPLPPDELISNLDDAESELAERLDSSHYRDDILRLLFIC